MSVHYLHSSHSLCSHRTLLTMSTLANPLVSVRIPKTYSSSGSPLKHADHTGPSNLSLSPIHQKNGKISISRRSTVQAAYSGDSGRSSSASIFVGGFILGGMVVGTLGAVYAPQISKALAGTDKKELLRKLPRFIYDEEKELEKTRKILTEKIEQLNFAIDDVSSQLRPKDAQNGVPVKSVKSDEMGASI